MSQPIGPQNLQPAIAAPTARLALPKADRHPTDAADFNSTLLQRLDEVNRLQAEAEEGVEKLALGETNNVAEVFSAVQKADVAFSMLMEMRNKLVEAYREIQQIRV